MLQQKPGDDRRAFRLASLKASRALLVADKEEGILGGRWNCFLEKKRFAFIAEGACQQEIYGVFEKVGGKWRATITEERWACKKD